MQGPLLICFIGIDGSGKTTQAKLLVEWLACRGIKSHYVWSRGPVLAIRSILLFIGRTALGTSTREVSKDEKSYREYQTHKSRLMRNSFVRTLWSAMTCIEHLVQINRDIRRKMLDGYVVVADRYLWDSTIDLAILNNKKPEWLSGRLNRFLWHFVPKPTVTILIEIPANEAMKRKVDIPSYEYIQRRAELYRFLTTYNSINIVNGSSDVLEIKESIVNIVKNFVEGKEKA